MMISKALGGLMGCLLAASCSVTAQDPNLPRNVEFVRGLATQLGLIEVAQTLAEDLQRDNQESDDFKLVSQLSIEISLTGARNHPNREERRTLFKEAIDRSTQFIERYEGEPVAQTASVTLIEACYDYGSLLNEEMEVARTEAPDQVADLRTRAEEAYRLGADTCDAVRDALEEDREDPNNTDAQRDFVVSWLYKGMILREHARASERDRSPLALMARSELEELIFEIGEDSLIGMRAYLEMSKIGEVEGKYLDAVRDFEDTIDSIWESLTSEDLNLPIPTQEVLFELMQRAYSECANAQFQLGDNEAVLQLSQQFRERLKEMVTGEDDILEIAHPIYGHPVLLTEARAMAESGDPELVSQSLEQVRRINDGHPNDFVGLRAKMVLKEILAGQSSAASGTLLWEIAKGEYADATRTRVYEPAVMATRRAYAAMTDEERTTNGLAALTQLGYLYGLQRRYMESTVTLGEALDRYGDGDGDVQRTADLLERAWSNFQRSSRGDRDANLLEEGNRVTMLLGRFGGAGSASRAIMKEVRQLILNKQYDVAATKLRTITPDTPEYEPAQGRLILVLELDDQFAAARQAIANYRSWLQTPAAKIASGDTARETVRAQTLATAEFEEIFMDYREATGGVEGKEADLTRYPDLVSALTAYKDEHRQGGAIYIERVYDYLGRLQSATGDLADAERWYNTLRKEFPNSIRYAPLATVIFGAHSENVANEEIEFQNVTKDMTDRNQVQAAREKLDGARRDALKLGLDYARNAAEPQYAMLWNSLLMGVDLDQWDVVEELGKQIIERYGDDPKTKPRVDRFVRVRLGESYLRRRQFQQAAPLFEAAIAAGEAGGNSNYAAMRLQALTLGGWYEFDRNGNLVDIKALERPAEAYDLYWGQYKTYALHPTNATDYDINWYRFHWECYQFAQRAAVADSEYRSRAQTLYNKAEAFEEFATLATTLGPDGRELADLFRQVPPQ